MKCLIFVQLARTVSIIESVFVQFVEDTYRSARDNTSGIAGVSPAPPEYF